MKIRRAIGVRLGGFLMRKLLFVLPVVFTLGACETPTSSRYSISADNNLAIKRLNTTGVAVAEIQEPQKYDVACRLAGNLKAPDGLTHAQYIKKALEDELKVAGAYAEGSSRVTLSGKVETLNVGSMHGLTNGVWDIELRLISSNGKTMLVTEHYKFKSGFSAAAACPNTAQAFMPAVQNLIRSAVTSPEFPAMVSQ